MRIISNNVEAMRSSSQQHKKWQKWDLLICNNFSVETKNSKLGKHYVTEEI